MTKVKENAKVETAETVETVATSEAVQTEETENTVIEPRAAKESEFEGLSRYAIDLEFSPRTVVLLDAEEDEDGGLLLGKKEHKTRAGKITQKLNVEVEKLGTVTVFSSGIASLKGVMWDANNSAKLGMKAGVFMTVEAWDAQNVG